LAQAPSFYQRDLDKWEKRFEKANQERHTEKRMIDIKLNGPQPTFGIANRGAREEMRE